MTRVNRARRRGDHFAVHHCQHVRYRVRPITQLTLQGEFAMKLLCRAFPVALFVFSLHMWAQSTPGTLLGNAMDAQSAPVVGANVTVTSVEKGYRRTTVTNREGYYEVVALQPGSYNVEITSPGMKKFVQDG